MERVTLGPCTKGFYLEASGNNFNRTFINCLAVPPWWSPLTGCSLGLLINASGPDVSYGFTQSDFAASLGQELKQLKPRCLLIKGVVMQGLGTLPVAKHPEFSTLVTLCISPNVLLCSCLSNCTNILSSNSIINALPRHLRHSEIMFSFFLLF